MMAEYLVRVVKQLKLPDIVIQFDSHSLQKLFETCRKQEYQVQMLFDVMNYSAVITNLPSERS